MRFGRKDDATEGIRAIDVGLEWDVGAPMPALLQAERTFLVFYLRYDPSDPRQDQETPVGVIEWLHCRGAVLGGLNDEAIHGYPVWDRGLRQLGAYSAAEVSDSRWIGELELANRVHSSHDASMFASLRHFVAFFHDETFECVARGFRSYRTERPITSVLLTLASLVLFSRDEVPYGEVLADPGPPIATS